MVSISGEVFRPGTYELFPGEGLEALIVSYGDGFTLDADKDRIRISRVHTLEGISGETWVTSYKELAQVSLEDRDRVVVGNKLESRPVVFFEGALAPKQTGVEETTAEIEGAAKLEYFFYPGETVGYVVRTIRQQFATTADLGNAYIIRGEQQIAVNLLSFLYGNDFSQDIVLENRDTIIVPFRQYFVLVSGAVKFPGRYPYVPDRPVEYYISLAGGRDELLNNGRGVTVFDMYQKKRPLESFITPESLISVPINSFTARFNQVAPIITTVLSLLSATLSIFALSGIL
jgi:protein involved in polysaccharide export with SLBB domain